MHNTIKINFSGLSVILLAAGLYFFAFVKPEMTRLIPQQPERACHVMMGVIDNTLLAVAIFTVTLLLVQFFYIYQKAISGERLPGEKIFLRPAFNIAREFLIAVFNSVIGGLLMLALFLIQAAFDCALLQAPPG